VSELNAFLRNKLPDYMVPSTVIFLDSLPLTNGKLDRSALPKPNHSRPDVKTPYVAPGNEVETKLSQIWGAVLILDQVGVDDNFFDLGGNSLAGAAVIARVQDVFGVQLPVSELFTSPTVAQLSESIGHQQKDKTTMQLLPKTGAVEFAPTIHVQPTTPFTGFSRDEVEQSIPERFEKIVRLYPDRIAVKAGNQVVTYSELNAMANRVGYLIIAQRGTEPEPVGLLVEKGVEQIAVMLGILKAGKFFVLLDPTCRVQGLQLYWRMLERSW
jgi:acyl carrier protein